MIMCIVSVVFTVQGILSHGNLQTDAQAKRPKKGDKVHGIPGVDGNTAKVTEVLECWKVNAPKN